MATSIDPTQRKLMVAVVMATLLALAIVIADLARGGRPDPPTLLAAATLLDGAWRFHTGDDPRWADASIDDSGWETIDLTALPGSHDGDVGLPDYVGGWMAHGHPGHTGYAWYRRAVTVPAGRVRALLERPTARRGRAGSVEPRVSPARGRCGSPFPQMRRVPVACSLSAYSCGPRPRPAQTAAACTARPYWLRGR
jgi:hypothetical protein